MYEEERKVLIEYEKGVRQQKSVFMGGNVPKMIQAVRVLSNRTVISGGWSSTIMIHDLNTHQLVLAKNFEESDVKVFEEVPNMILFGGKHGRIWALSPKKHTYMRRVDYKAVIYELKHVRSRGLVAVGTASRLHLICDDTLNISFTINLESEVKDVLVLSKDFLLANVKGSRLVRLDMNSKS